MKGRVMQTEKQKELTQKVNNLFMNGVFNRLDLVVSKIAIKHEKYHKALEARLKAYPDCNLV